VNPVSLVSQVSWAVSQQN